MLFSLVVTQTVLFNIYRYLSILVPYIYIYIDATLVLLPWEGSWAHPTIAAYPIFHGLFCLFLRGFMRFLLIAISH